MFLRLAGDRSRHEQRLRRKRVHTLEFTVVQGKAISYVSHEQMVKNLCQNKVFADTINRKRMCIYACILYTLQMLRYTATQQN